MGTTVKIHLPACTATPSGDAHLAEQRPQGSGEVILVVEDETEVRRMSERILGNNGYTVIATQGGEEALRVCQREEQPIDLVLTDVIMPGILGSDLIDQMPRAAAGCPQSARKAR